MTLREFITRLEEDAGWEDHRELTFHLMEDNGNNSKELELATFQGNILLHLKDSKSEKEDKLVICVARK